jgi:hypothetical protein
LNPVEQKKLLDSLRAAGREAYTFVKTDMSGELKAKLDAFLKKCEAKSREPITLGGLGSCAAAAVSYSSEKSSRYVDGDVKRKLDALDVDYQTNKMFADYLSDKSIELGEDFEKFLLMIYKAAGINRVFKTRVLQSTPKKPYKPDKATAIKIGLILKLSLDEMNQMLAYAGYALSRNVDDRLVQFCIENNYFDRDVIDNIFMYRTGSALFVQE